MSQIQMIPTQAPEMPWIYESGQHSIPDTCQKTNLGEAPVGVDGDDGRDSLRDAERAEESVRRTLHEEEAVRTSDEDEGLRDDCDLKVDDGVQHTVVVVDRWWRLEVCPEGVLKECGLDDDDNQRDSAAWLDGSAKTERADIRRQGEPETISDSVSEDLAEVPRIRRAGRKDAVD
jgi:hypothetical protein